MVQVLRQKRGQAALEFLTTYGWAFLVVLIMIGALAYFGVLNPSKVLPERCLVTAGFDCQDHLIVDSGGTTRNVTMVMVNQVGKSVTINTIARDSPADMTLGTCTIDVGAGPAALPVQVGTSQQMTITCDLSGGNPPSSGDKMKVELQMTYIQSGGSFNHSAGLEVFATIQ